MHLPDDSAMRALGLAVGWSAKLQDAATEAEACDILTQAAGAFDGSAAFISIVKDEEQVETQWSVIAGDSAWSLEYEQLEGYGHDPWLAHARKSAEMRSMAELKPQSERQASLVAMAQRHGFGSGFVVPVHAPRGLTRLGVLYMGTALSCPGALRRLPALAFAAASLAVLLNRWQLSRLRADLKANARIGSGDLQLLSLERDGWSSKEVSRLLGIHHLAVDSRWRRLNARLRVTSRARAAKLAAEYGLI